MWVDPPREGLNLLDPLNSNYGLVNIYDEPYDLVINAAKNTNNQVYDLRK
jgi:hypothetical protein